ncbi:hypothetical protein RFI_00844 [Reticulomyxa filosa]|uniref:RING-type domain-containing protein n=1 Tax=Reticulomyxa filosa TaxID=46433 RepID=X6PDN6_RETFI|nr:hypothetical protein RFI_00844 [Reticulomyxa filosa]|eukprot:ETO36218.1 hypothetical protein RFI_00844 [Reticulomyxa filosa]
MTSPISSTSVSIRRSVRLANRRDNDRVSDFQNQNSTDDEQSVGIAFSGDTSTLQQNVQKCEVGTSRQVNEITGVTNANSNTSDGPTQYLSNNNGRARRRNHAEMESTDNAVCNSQNLSTTSANKKSKGRAETKDNQLTKWQKQEESRSMASSNKITMRFIVVNTMGWDETKLDFASSNDYILCVNKANRFIDLLGSLYDCGFVSPNCRLCGKQVSKTTPTDEGFFGDDTLYFECDDHHGQNLLMTLHNTVRIWLPLYVLLPVYATSGHSARTPGIGLDSVYRESKCYRHKWTQLPMDRLYMPFSDLEACQNEDGDVDDCESKSDKQHQSRSQKHSSKKPFTVLLEMYDVKHGIWPIGNKYHPNFETVNDLDQLKIGDIVYACDYKTQWFTSYIRMIDRLKQQICVHWLFWDKKWDEWLPLQRVQSVNNHTLYYNLPFTNMYAMDVSQVNNYQHIHVRTVFGSKDITSLLKDASEFFRYHSHVSDNDDDDNNKLDEGDQMPMEDWDISRYLPMLQYYNELKKHVNEEINANESKRWNEEAIGLDITMSQHKLNKLELRLDEVKTKLFQLNRMKHGIHNLPNNFKQWFQELETGFLEWNTQETKCWIRHTFTKENWDINHNDNDNNGNSDCHQQEIVKALLEYVDRHQICGKDLPEINDLILQQSASIVRKSDRNIILFHLNKLKIIQKNSVQSAGECPTCCGPGTTKGLVPCGHVGFCDRCAQLLLQNKLCPICRRTITDVITIYRVGVVNSN